MIWFYNHIRSTLKFVMLEIQDSCETRLIALLDPGVGRLSATMAVDMDEITYPFLNFNGGTVEVWEWIIDFISHFTGHVITYSC